MNIIAFNGSPRKGGNTQILLEEAMRGAKEQGADLTVFDLNGQRGPESTDKARLPTRTHETQSVSGCRPWVSLRTR